MPDTETLTPDQLKEIEARPAALTSKFKEIVLLTPDERDVLCRSLRAAWASVHYMQAAYDETRGRLTTENTALREQLATQAESITYFQENEKSLKAQLAQAQKRLDDALVRAVEDQDEHSAQRADLAKKLAQVEQERNGCQHCSCACDGCAPCGETENL